ncbi:MAG: M48 family metallopeptidase [Rhodocyclaceae bacterium]|nr:M48 family metallopeptidase [Rhodocyclaceae bacterium]
MPAAPGSLGSGARCSVQAMAYGAGFAATGTPLSVELDAQGFSLRAPDGRELAVPWSAAGVRRHGFNDSRCEIAWHDGHDRCALSLGDAAIIAELYALPALREAAAAQRTSRARRDRATRRWVLLLLAIAALPLLLFGLVLWQFDSIVSRVVSGVPVAHERAIGSALIGRYTEGKQIVAGPAADMLRELGQKLTQGSRYSYDFRIVHEPGVNAYALPGGYVVVHSGLLRVAENAEQVAGVLAHEISHVEGRHGLASLVRSAGLAAVFALVMGDTGAFATLSRQVTDLKFSRDTETRADRDGLERLVRAGIDPAGMAEFFKQLDASAARMPDWISSHPAPLDRHAAVQEAIAKLPPAARQVPRLPYDYATIKAALPAAEQSR